MICKRTTHSNQQCLQSKSQPVTDDIFNANQIVDGSSAWCMCIHIETWALSTESGRWARISWLVKNAMRYNYHQSLGEHSKQHTGYKTHIHSNTRMAVSSCKCFVVRFGKWSDIIEMPNIQVWYKARMLYGSKKAIKIA